MSDCFTRSHTIQCVLERTHISCYSNIVVNCQPNSERKQWHSPKTAVESPTFATKMLSCLNITVETVVPAVLRSPILFLFHVPVKPSSGNGTVKLYVRPRSCSHTKKPARFQAPPPAPRKEGLGMGTRFEKSRRSRQSEHLVIRGWTYYTH